MVERRADHGEEQARVAVRHERDGAAVRNVPEVVTDGADDAGPEGRGTGADLQE